MKTVRIKVVVQSKKENVPGWPHINYGYDKKTEEIMSSVREYNPDATFDVVRYTSPSQAEEAFELRAFVSAEAVRFSNQQFR